MKPLLLLAVALAAFGQNETIMDDPLAEQRLNREIWESARKTPYADIIRYVEASQKRANKAATVELPSGWKIAPAGSQIAVGELPFHALAFNGTLAVLNSGYATGGTQDFTVIDPLDPSSAITVPVKTMFPAAVTGPGSGLYLSGGDGEKVYRFNSSFQTVATYALPGFVYGLAALDSRYLVAAYMGRRGIKGSAHATVIDTETGATVRTSELAEFSPHSVTVASGKVYVTIPAANQLLVLDRDLNLRKTLSVGRTPLTTCTSGSLLYVVNTNSDEITVIHTADDSIQTRFSVKFRDNAWGAAPASCAAVGDHLYVTLSLANAVAVLDRASGALKGYIPTGWYPTSVLTINDQLVTVSAKGIQPRRPNPNGEYILTLLKGSVGLIPLAGIAANLPAWTTQVLSSSPLIVPPGGGRSGIRHIFYIVKENRTYDQVLGDLPKGNGDPTLTIFGRSVTPVQHYLAEEFATLDNFYATGEVSTVGHSWTSSAYASPIMQMLTSLEYAGRYPGSSTATPSAFSPVWLWDAMDAQKLPYRIYGELVYFSSLVQLVMRYFGPQSEMAAKMQYLSTRQEKASTLYRPLSALLARHASQARTVDDIRRLLRDPGFGQPFSRFFTGGDSLYQALVSDSRFLGELAMFLSKYAWQYRPFDQSYSDLDRVASWIPEFQAKDAAGEVENLHLMVLPNDHTSGSNPGGLSPAEFVAQNDAALDLILRTLAKSRIWPHTLVLVVEDDAQNGPDHVDGTRTTAYVAGPSLRRRVVVSDVYDQVSMVRTIGLILGLPALSMNDALAVPMVGIFAPPGTKPNLTYNPPPVSNVLVPEDRARYEELLASLRER